MARKQKPGETPGWDKRMDAATNLARNEVVEWRMTISKTLEAEMGPIIDALADLKLKAALHLAFIGEQGKQLDDIECRTKAIESALYRDGWRKSSRGKPWLRKKMTAGLDV